MKKLLLLSVMGLMAVGLQAQRVVDEIDRGIVAVPNRTGSGNLVTWRIFGSEYYDVAYNLYRNGTKVNSQPLTVSNFSDAGGSSSSVYQVAPVVKGVEQEKSAEVKAWGAHYKDVPVKPVVNRAGRVIGNSVTAGASTTSGYTLNDVSLADVDGDGVCELIVKRINSTGNIRQTSNTTDFNFHECYRIDGTLLWKIDMGPNMMSGPDEQFDIIGYDWDRDGKAEVLMRGADNMIIYAATGDTIRIGNMSYDNGAGSSERSEYTHKGKEYLLYMDGATGVPFGYEGGGKFTPMDYPLPRFEVGEAADVLNSTSAEYAAVWGEQDTGHRSSKHYFGAPYLDGRHASIFLGRGCYTRHKACALDVDPVTHKLTQRWRWNCYSPGPWFGNGFHNFAIADVDMDGRDEIVYGSMILDDTGYGLCTTGLGHGDAAHCGDLDPYRWGLEQFTCQEGSQGNSYWCAATGQMYYRKQDGGDDGRALAGNFTDLYPGCQGRSVSSGVIGLSCDKVVDPNGDAMSGSYANLNMRIYWDDDLLSEIFNSSAGEGRAGRIYKWGGRNLFTTSETTTNNSSKCNPSAQGDILGDWREELVLRASNNSFLRIYTTNYPTEYRIPTLWHDHVYRNGMVWQCVGYNQPPHTSFFLGAVEGITIAPPPLILTGRSEIHDGATIGTSLDDKHVLLCDQADAEVTLAEGARPWVFTDNAACWVQGTGSQQATSSTPKQPERINISYTHTVKGAAFSGTTRVVKQGEGTLVLPTLTHTHTGATDVWNGTLRFDGTLESSPLWLNRHTTLVTDGGQFMGGLTADYNSTLYIGQGKKSTLTTTRLGLNIGARVVFDIYDDTTSDLIRADRIVVEKKTWEYGPKYSSPVFQIVVNDTLADGSYLLAEAGEIVGDIGEIVLEGISDRRNMLRYEDGKLYLDVEAFHQPTTVAWQGQEDNVWDAGITENFVAGDAKTYAAFGDDVVFPDGAQQTTVRVKGAVYPASVTFNNETTNYTLTGDSIMNAAPITKNGAATTTIYTENRTGNTVVNGGKLMVNYLANNIGQQYGALGDASRSITLNDGTTLSVSEITLTDQQLNVSGEASLEVASGRSLTFNKGFKSTDQGILHKKGEGSLTMGTGHTISRLVIDQGTVTAVPSNNVDQIPATVEFNNGTLWGSTMDDNPGRTVNANFDVPEKKSGTFYGPYRGSINGRLTGKGTMNVYSGGVRCYWNGDWSAFEGTLIPGTRQRQAKPSYDPSFDWNNDYGLPLATLQVPEGVTFNYGSHPLRLGNAAGKGTINGTGAITIGTRNEDINFQGTFKGMAVQKVGEGVWTIDATHQQMSLARIFVMGGTLNVYSLNSGSCYLSSQATVTVNEGGTLTGTSILPNACNVYSGGTVTVGRLGLVNRSGEMSFLKQLNMRAGSTLNLNIRNANNQRSSRTYLTVGTTLTLNGTVNITLDESYEPKAGDDIVLWTANVFAGRPTLELPQLPDGLAWDTTSLLAKEGHLRVVSQTEGIELLPASATVGCTVYTVGGQQVAQFEARKGDVAKAARKHGLSRGTYVVEMRANGMRATQKMQVK